MGVLGGSPHSVKEGDPRKCGLPPRLFILLCFGEPSLISP